MRSTDRDDFVAARQDRWRRIEALLLSGLSTPDDVDALAHAYRCLAADLATAQSAGLAPDLLAYLDDLAGRAHHRLYGARAPFRFDVPGLVFRRFPRTLRRRWRLFLLANLLFYGPYLVALFSCVWNPDLATHVLPTAQLEQFEAMYSTATARTTDQDAQMAGFYVMNNIGIALRTFATGVFAGLGSLFFLIYNGAMLGTVFGYLLGVGKGFNLLVFTSGHAAWELTGIVVAGTAGLRLGWSLLVTEGRSRIVSLRAAGVELADLVAGAVALIFMAALIEGFWSASPIPWPIKLAFGAAQILVVVAWLALGGRR